MSQSDNVRITILSLLNDFRNFRGGLLITKSDEDPSTLVIKIRGEHTLRDLETVYDTIYADNLLGDESSGWMTLRESKMDITIPLSKVALTL